MVNDKLPSYVLIIESYVYITSKSNPEIAGFDLEHYLQNVIMSTKIVNI